MDLITEANNLFWNTIGIDYLLYTTQSRIDTQGLRLVPYYYIIPILYKNTSLESRTSSIYQWKHI